MKSKYVVTATDKNPISEQHDNAPCIFAVITLIVALLVGASVYFALA